MALSLCDNPGTYLTPSPGQLTAISNNKSPVYLGFMFSLKIKFVELQRSEDIVRVDRDL